MTNKGPSWLPNKLCYADYNGDWDKFIESVYKIFQSDFKDTKPIFRNLFVIHDTRIEFGKEAGFWHIIQKDEASGERLPDLRRCEHISWPRPMIDNSDDVVISLWENEIKKPGHGRQTRVSIWLENEDYIVILKQSNNCYVLVTAYCVLFESYREKLRKQRDNYYKTKAAP
jgi:hypothetical protein